jgi:diaminopimelate epimerase
MRLVKTHGSLNEIFALAATPADWASDAELREFVRRVCDRDSWTGGSDGIYLYDAGSPRARAWFFNPDGSSAEFCGNGMRGLGRLILDLRGTDVEVIASGGRDYTVRRAPSTTEGVRQVLLELPGLRFPAAPPAPFEDFTAVNVPNPHVVAIVPEYSEPDLIEAGKRADEVFPEGANVSFLLPLPPATPTTTPPAPPASTAPRASETTTPSALPASTAPRASETTTSAPLASDTPDASEVTEVFVRTFERGAGLTPSCGSGVVASRAVYSRVTGLDPGQRLVVRNAGGVAAASIRVRAGEWLPVLEGNATVVYHAEVDPSGRQLAPIEYADEENAAYAALDERNTAHLKANGITTAHP